MNDTRLWCALSGICHRWLLVGPKRSGSKVHIDPLGTSAWNTLLYGRKLWVLSPPGTLEILKGATNDAEEDDEEDDRPKYAIDYFVDVLPGLRSCPRETCLSYVMTFVQLLVILISTPAVRS